MAGYREHISVSGLCGVGYGLTAVYGVGVTPVQGALAGILTWVGGMLPDLDSESGKPIRELFCLVAALVPMVAMKHLMQWCRTTDGVILASILAYGATRYGGSWLLKRLSVHRGMFHSFPAMVIAGELVFLAYMSESHWVKLLMAGGVMLGFLSHLVLDELYSIEWSGTRVKLSRSAGTAMKMVGKGFYPNVFTYALLMFLTWLTLVDVGLIRDPKTNPYQSVPQYRQATETTPSRF